MLIIQYHLPPGIDKHCFNAESDLLESLLNRDSPIYSTKIDSTFDEFSLPRPLEESNFEISDATIEFLCALFHLISPLKDRSNPTISEPLVFAVVSLSFTRHFSYLV
ncbi:hypothetical protein Tco_1379171 [Tanacetum coccineum]